MLYEDDPTPDFVRRASDGEGEAVGWLVEHFSPAMLLSARARTPVTLQPLLCPDDVVNDSWSEAIPGLHRVVWCEDRSPTESLLAWLQGVQLNRLRTLKRQLLLREEELVRRWRHPLGRTLSSVPRGDESVTTQAMRLEEAERLQQAIADLPFKVADVLRQRGIEQIPLAVVAQRSGEDRNTVAQRYSRGLKELRRLLPRSIFERFAIPDED